MNLNKRLALICVGAFASISLASAQGSGPDGVSTKASTDASNGETGALAEIVVTAQKKSESAQRTAAAVSVLLGDDLIKSGVTDIKAAEVLLPSTKLNVENSAVQVFIRGVGSQIDVTYMPESVAVSFNDVYLPRFAVGAGFFDIERIESLPGPQGTLYGRSAVGGAINVITNKPTNDTYTDALVEYGNYATKHVTLVQNAAVSDSWAVRGAVDYLDNDGYNDNGTYSTDSIAARLSSLYKSGLFSALFTASYSDNRSRPSPTQYVPYPNGDAYSYPPTDPSTAAFYPPDGIPNSGSHAKYENTVISGRLDWDLGSVNITYLPGLLRSTTNDDRVVAAFRQPVDISVDQFSNELRISGSAFDRLDFVGGLYQLWDKTYQFAVFGPNFSGGTIRTRANSYASYGQGTYSVSDRVRVTVGARLSRDDQKAYDSEAYYPIFPDLSRGTVPFTFSDNWKKVGWKTGLEYDVSRHSLLYGAVQTGFNPGTFDATLPNAGAEVRPQSMTGYTAGLKNLLWDGRIRLNLEGFLYDYKDLVIQAADFTSGVTRLLNAPRVRINGAEMSFAIAPIKDLELHATVGYLNAEIREFSAGASAGALVNYAGYQLPFSPPYTATIGAAYSYRLGSAGSLSLRADSYISAAYWDIFSHTSNLRQDGFTKTNVSLTYTSPSEKWDVALYGDNLENVATSGASGETGRPYPFAGVVYYSPPRLYGVRFHLRVGER